MVQAVKPGGLVLDLQVIRVSPRVETGGGLLWEIDGEPLFRKADAATAAVDRLVAAGCLVEEAVDDHDVLKHYLNGPDLVDDFAHRERRRPPETLARPPGFVGAGAARGTRRARSLR